MFESEDMTVRVRYDPETNLIFWGLAINKGSAIWVRGGERSLADATSLTTTAAVVILALM